MSHSASILSHGYIVIYPCVSELWLSQNKKVMEKLTFSTTINAPREKVWETLWDSVSYAQWCDVFSPGSVYEGELSEGSKVYFLGPDRSGMVSSVAEKRPNEYMAFKHLGVLNKGVEDLESDTAKLWAGAYETYTLQGEGQQTVLTVTTETTDEYVDYFNTTWPQALERLKSLAERTVPA